MSHNDSSETLGGEMDLQSNDKSEQEGIKRADCIDGVKLTPALVE